jgi:hypothetical protein
MEWPDKEIKAPFRICNGWIRPDCIRMFSDSQSPANSAGLFFAKSIFCDIHTQERESINTKNRWLSRDDEPLPYISMIARVHRFTALIDFSDYARQPKSHRIGEEPFIAHTAR